MSENENRLSAPVLQWDGDNFNGKGSYTEQNPLGYYFYRSAQELTSYILNTLSGKHGNLIKLMWVLLGTAPGFRISEKWILEKTGMTQQRYSEARTTLDYMGWITYNKKHHTITVNYRYMWKEAEKEKKNRIDVLSIAKKTKERRDREKKENRLSREWE